MLNIRTDDSLTALDNTRYVATLARTVDQLRRSPEPGEPQKAALGALVEAAAERSAMIRWYRSVLTVESVEIPTADPRLSAFTERLAAHGVAELAIAIGAEAPELLALSLALAAEPGQGRLKERLRDAASMRVMVVVHQAVDPSYRPVGVSGAFAKVKADQATLAEWNSFLNHGAAHSVDHHVDIGLKDRATGEIQININARSGERAAIMGNRAEEMEQAAPPTPPAAPAEPVAQAPAAAPAAPAPPPSAPAAPAPPEARAPRTTQSLQQPPTLHAASPLGIGLAHILQDPYGKDLLNRLTPLARSIEDSFSRGNVAEAVDAVNALIELETKAPDPGVRGTYHVIMSRTLTRAALAKAAPYLLEQRRRARAAVVLRRGGEAASGLLVDLIVQAHNIGERLLYFEVLKEIPQGSDKLLSMLSSRGDWQLTRNIAELAGEAKLDGAVPYLARLVEHGDDRVKRAALVAMAKIGTVGTIEPIRGILSTGPREMKALVVTNIAGFQARALTVPLATFAESDEDNDIAREMVKAIGRIGTPEAKRVLEKMSASKTIFSRRGRVLREAAEEALKTIPAAAPPA
ncbi:MAG TPA: HEAT repeat domain-containing protein [Gemmatimonadales bacterium]